MKKWVLPVAVALIFAVLLSKIYLASPTIQLLGDTGDNYEYFSYQTLVHDNLKNGRYPLAKSDLLRYPNGFELGYGSDGFFVLFTGAILQFFIPQPLTYNISLIMVLMFNFLGALLLFRELSRKNSLGYLGGLMYGMSPYVLARINAHINLATVGGIAFLGYALLKVWRRWEKRENTTFRDALTVWAGVLLASLGSLQYALLSVEVGLILLVVALILKPSMAQTGWNLAERMVFRSIRAWFFSFLVFIPVYLFFFYPYIWAILMGKVTVFPKNLEECCRTRPLDIFLFNKYAGEFWGKFNSSSLSIEKVVTIGIIEWILLALALILEKKWINRLFVIACIIMFSIVSFGYIKLPLVPEAWRSIAVFSLVFIGYIILKLKNIPSKGILRFIPWLIMAAVIAERLSQTIYISPPLPYKLFETVKTLPGTGILNIPLSEYKQFRNVLPYFTDKKIVDGYFHYTAENTDTLHYLNESVLKLFKCPSYPTGDNLDTDVKITYDLLRKYDIRTIILHKDPKTEIYYHPDCDSMKDWWYYVNPESLNLDQTKDNPTSFTFSLPRRNILKTKIYFPTDGTFVLYKALLYPSSMKEVWFNSPDGVTFIPDWKPVENLNVGVQAIFDKPYIYEGKAGDSITITSPYSVGEPVFITLDYYFQKTGTTRIKPDIESVYNDNEYEVYVIQN